MDKFNIPDIRNAKTIWFVVAQITYYLSEKHKILDAVYYRIFRYLVNTKGGSDV